VRRDLLIDGALLTPEDGGEAALDRAQFDHLSASGTVEGQWEDGEPADG
jgi:hypothetical protein